MAIQPEQILEGIVPIFTKGIIVIIGIAFFMVVIKLSLKSISKSKERYEVEPRYESNANCQEMGAVKILLIIIVVQTTYIIYSLFKLGIGE
jgi:NADH:ubiquinone oxidoreductase subunit 3 (subunit A)